MVLLKFVVMTRYNSSRSGNDDESVRCVMNDR